MERLDEEEEGLMEVLDSGSILSGIERDEEMEGFLNVAANPAVYHGSIVFSQKSIDCSSTSSKTATRRKVEASSSCGTSCSSNKYKKLKREGSANSVGIIKVRKDKLGERISALQQLVSPFGKSDTASVLTEALGYIHSLHDQVQVLSSPYLKRMPTTASQQQGGQCDAAKLEDLRSRGLCLVPISYTEEVANDNGADLWSYLMRTNFYYLDL